MEKGSDEVKVSNGGKGLLYLLDGYRDERSRSCPDTDSQILLDFFINKAAKHSIRSLTLAIGITPGDVQRSIGYRNVFDDLLNNLYRRYRQIRPAEKERSETHLGVLSRQPSEKGGNTHGLQRSG